MDPEIIYGCWCMLTWNHFNQRWDAILFQYTAFLHNRLWILLWIKLISYSLNIIIHMIASQLYSCDKLFLHTLECYFGVYFPRCFATREINTKITLLWALKQLITRVHTSFSIYYFNNCVLPYFSNKKQYFAEVFYLYYYSIKLFVYDYVMI